MDTHPLSEFAPWALQWLQDILAGLGPSGEKQLHFTVSTASLCIEAMHSNRAGPSGGGGASICKSILTPITSRSTEVPRRFAEAEKEGPESPDNELLSIAPDAAYLTPPRVVHRHLETTDHYAEGMMMQTEHADDVRRQRQEDLTLAKRKLEDDYLSTESSSDDGHAEFEADSDDTLETVNDALTATVSSTMSMCYAAMKQFIEHNIL